ncbi:hypothetical protein T02_10386 [Trichinella nativa]|uniref:Apple domain-containing protein n=2 Tax=Trichinella nativa TaxID=6335 RepID=A0A0V1LAS4_9BILA|nr:hypothetical protein T02_10386 [Trichinella nativa]
MHHLTKTVFLLLLLNFVQCEELLMYVDIVSKSCYVERINAETSPMKSVDADLETATLSSCIGLCKSFEEENECNIVAYSNESNICKMFTSDGPTYFTDDKSSSYFFIKHCELEDADVHNTETVHDIIYLPETSVTCEVEYYIGNSVYGFGYLEESDGIENLENCLSLCQMLANENGCTAVEYLQSQGKCRLFKPSIVRLVQTYDGSFTKIIECHEQTPANVNEPEESEILVEGATKNGSVAVVELYERCDVTYHATKENFGFQTFKEMRSIKNLNRCLFLCRVDDACKAVLFAPKDKMCNLAKKSGPTSKVDKSDNQLFVQINICEKDRVQERLHNPSPIKYYLPEIEEVCEIEFYVLPKLTSWLQIGNSVKARDLIECLQACKVLEHIQQCSAVNFSIDRECVLLKRGKPENEYTVLQKSLFGEFVNCFEESIVELLS